MSTINGNDSRPRLRLHIGGTELALVTEEDPEKFRSLAEEIDARLRMIDGRSARLDAALFVCLGYAEELRESEAARAADAAAAEASAAALRAEAELLRAENEELKTLLGGAGK